MIEEKTIDWYLDRAKENQNYSSDRKLCQELGYSGNTVTFFRKGTSLPSPEKMEKISKLAGVDPQIGLMHLAIWNAHGEAKKTYRNILKKITASIAFLLLFFASTSPAYAAGGALTGVTLTNALLYIITSKLDALRHYFFKAVNGLLNPAIVNSTPRTMLSIN